MSERFPCTYVKACYCLYGYFVLRWSQTQIAIEVGLNVGTVNHVVHGRRFPDARPLPF